MDEPTAAPGLSDYPVRLDIDHQEKYSRFLPLVKWLLLLPHYLILFVLLIVAYVAVIASWFAVLITGRYPRVLFEFILGVQRWRVRVGAYMLLMVDPYPPFALEDLPDYPARLQIDYPEDGVARWRPLVAWLIVIPYLIVSTIIFYIAEVLVFFAFFTILFTRSFPKGMFDIVLVAARWQERGFAYAIWMTTRYPPFVWD
jgi:Domain of unknown function (DUF4389)